jgi:hypothetical protein
MFGWDRRWEVRMEPEAIRLMRAIKERYPDVEAGDFVDPFIAAAQDPSVDLDPNDPMFRAALHELLEAEVLRHSTAPEHLSASIKGTNPQFEVTPEGAQRIIESS